MLPQNSVAPSSFPSRPFTSSTPTIVTAPSMSLSPTSETIAFFCSRNGVEYSKPPFSAVTVVDINVTYEVDTTTPWQNVREDLEVHILKAAVSGALQCGNYYNCVCEPPSVPMLTQKTAETCQPIANDTTCSVLETDFQILIREVADPKAVSYFAYVFLQQIMQSSDLERNITDLKRIEYLLPKIVLPTATNGPTASPAFARQTGTLSVSPWTVGSALAMSFGGATALLLWLRNRRLRNERHMQLLEEMSETSPPTASVNPPANQAEL